jgi:ATP-dependent Zn protease
VATPRKRSLKERRATAYHEAGHAVVDVVLGLTVNKVSIVQGKYHKGSCRGPGLQGYHFWTRREAQDFAKAIIISFYTGMPAERLFDPDAPDSHGEDD